MPLLENRNWKQLATVSAVSLGALVSARVLFRPVAKGQRLLIDWDAVQRAALARTGDDDAPFDAQELGRRYDGWAAELAPLMAEVCGSTPAGFPPFSVIDRRTFIDRNLENLQQLLAPVEEARANLPASQLTVWTRRLTDRYMGELFGFMSKRVLGQYDPVLLPSSGGNANGNSALYLVEPNIREFERRHPVPAEDLRRWLILHELTHAWQFESHPWLKEHLMTITNNLLGSVVDAAIPKPGQNAGTEALRRLPGVVKAQLRTLSEVQAIMSVLEGYSNFVMNRVGRKHIPNFTRLEQAFHRRQQDRSLLERIVVVVTGMRFKLRQYEVGERFATRVTESGGIDLLNRVWESPELMPTLAELRAPQLWVQRVKAAA